MFYTAENRDRRLGASVKERVILGKSEKRFCFCAPVVGRLISYKNTKSFFGKEALLTVVYGRPDDADACVFDDPRTVGIVFVSDTDGAVSEPSLPSISVYELPAEYDGRIALLDPEGDRLFISPDISTVNRYLPRLFKGTGDSLPSFILRDGKKLSLSVISNGDGIDTDRDSLIPLPLTEDAEELYLRSAEIVEGAVGRSVTFLLSNDEASVSAIGSVMRSAVWGDLSVLLCGILTEAELTHFLQKFCHAFCELETDRREFNGYICRGLCIDSPYLLSVADRLYGMDFFVFDAEALVSLYCGERKEPPEEVLTLILTLISKVTANRRDIPYGVILGERTLSPSFCKSLEECGIQRYVTSAELFGEMYRML